jgi:hypothetical protein
MNQFTKEELQLIITGLAELPAKISFNLIVKVNQTINTIENNVKQDII